MVGRLSPMASAREANEWRRSWMRTPSSPARARIRSQWSFRLERCPPRLRPRDHPRVVGGPGAGRRGTDTAAAGKGTTRGPRLAVAKAELGRLEVPPPPSAG